MDFDLCALFWKGYSLQSYDLISPRHLLFRLQIDSVAFCSGCQQSCLQVHDTVLRHVRDCDLLGYRLSLVVPMRRVNCPDCGRQSEHISWLSKHQRITDRLRITNESGLRPLMDFARKLKPYLRGILASAKYPLNTSVLEGINNKIKVIKRMAYGFRDNEYFFLKIKHAFPGK